MFTQALYTDGLSGLLTMTEQEKPRCRTRGEHIERGTSIRWGALRPDKDEVLGRTTAPGPGGRSRTEAAVKATRS